jgi:hypothetical protein
LYTLNSGIENRTIYAFFHHSSAVFAGANAGIWRASIGLSNAGGTSKARSAEESTISFRTFPNPSFDETNISFTLTRPQRVSIKVYNTLGEEVANPLTNQFLQGQQQYTIAWSANNIASGLYIVRFIADGIVSEQKIAIIR